MTALELLGYISAALLVQIAVLIMIAVRNYRRAPLPIISQSAILTPNRPPAAWAGLREFTVVRREFEDSAHTICSFYLQPVDGLALADFLPGQFITVSLVKQDSAKPAQTLSRCYSLSQPPGLNTYRISIKRAPAPAAKLAIGPHLVSHYFHDKINPGDVISLLAPAGQFFIDSTTHDSVVLIAGGIGITPFISMLLWCVEYQPTRAIYIYYGVKNSREQPFKTLLKSLAAQHANIHLTLAFSRPDEDDAIGVDYHRQGYVDINLLRTTLPLNAQQFYVCGPPAMMNTIVPGLLAWGVKRANIYFEAFGPASITTPPAEEAAPALNLEVKFQKSGHSLTWDGSDANLLEFAERNNIPIEAGCRAGNCGSCQTQLLSGAVSYALPPAFPIEPGHCLLCVGRPASALELNA